MKAPTFTLVPYHLALLLTTCHATPSPGCTNPSTNTHIPPSNSTHMITSSNQPRTFFLQVPATYDPSSHAGSPLILFFHGHNRTGADMAAQVRLDDPTLNPSALAVFPDGIQRAWQGAPYAAPGVDDVQFTLELLSHLSENLCIDTSRVYAAGSSNGGEFANRLACDARTSGKFAAFALNSPAVYEGSLPDGCETGRETTPILDVHGLRDPVVPYGGGESHWTGENGTHGVARVPSVRSFVLGWARRNGCRGDAFPEQRSSVPEIERFYEWNCSVKHYAMTKEGHGWMGDAMVDYRTGAPLDEAKIMVSFFNEFEL